MTSIGINGFGRLASLFLRSALAKNLNVVAINDPAMNPKSVAYQLKYSSNLGKYKNNILVGKDFIKTGCQKIQTTCKQNVLDIPWTKLGVKYVVDTTGELKTKKQLRTHILAGAKKVIITTPSAELPMIVMGVNATDYKQTMEFLSASSCNTSCLAPLLKYLDLEYNIEECLLTTVEAPTELQQCTDAISPTAWREGRSCLQSIIPSSLDIAESLPKVYPDLCYKVTGTSFIAPVAGASVAHMALHFKQPIEFKIFKEKLRIACKGFVNGYIDYEDKEIVSSDVKHRKASSIVDTITSEQLSCTAIKLIAWYDPEWSYANRLAELLEHIIEADKQPCGQEQLCS